MSLSGILKVIEEKPEWVEWSPGEFENQEGPDLPRGFAILLRPQDASDIQGLAQAAILEGHRQIKDQEDPGARMKPGMVGVSLLSYLVENWRGFTGRALCYFAAGVPALVVEASEDQIIKFSRELLEVLLQKSFRFYNFVDRVQQEKKDKSMAALEEEEANLSHAPGSLLTPSGAPGAETTTGSSKRRSSAISASGPTGGPETS